MLTKICSYTSGAVKMTIDKFEELLNLYGMNYVKASSYFTTLVWNNVVWGFIDNDFDYDNGGYKIHILKFSSALRKVTEKNLRKFDYQLMNNVIIERATEENIKKIFNDLIPKLKDKSMEWIKNDINKDFV